MRRRSYLALTTGALSATITTSLAGCTGSPGGTDDSTTDTTTTTRSTTTQTTQDEPSTTDSQTGPTVELREAVVQSAVVLLQTDYLTVAGQGGQYLLADVTVTGGEAPRDEFRFQFDGQSYGPMPQHETRRLWRVYNRGEYDPAAGGLLVFQLPESATNSDPETVLEFGSWEREVPPAVQTQLATPNPAFTIDATVTSPIEVGDSPRVTVTIENTSDVAGRFVAGLNRSGPSVASMPAARVSKPVDAGATVEYVHDATGVDGAEVPSDDLGDGEPDLEFRLNTPDTSTRLPVEYQASDG